MCKILNEHAETPYAVVWRLHVMHMTDVKKFNALGIIGIIGALLMIVGVFLNWLEFSITIPILGSENWSYSGMDIFSTDIIGEGENSINFSDITAYYYVPVVALACGVLSLILTIIPTVFNKEKIGKVLGALALVLAIITLVLAFLYYGDVSGYSFSESWLGFGAELSIGAGLWVVIAGSIITILGGIVDIAKKSA